jgi:hypothetical protein
VGKMWDRYASRLGIGHEDYLAYFSDATEAVGLHVGEVHAITPIPLTAIERIRPSTRLDVVTWRGGPLWRPLVKPLNPSPKHNVPSTDARLRFLSWVA